VYVSAIVSSSSSLKALSPLALFVMRRTPVPRSGKRIE